MRCEFCQGSGVINDGRVPCQECHGFGIISCCEVFNAEGNCKDNCRCSDNNKYKCKWDDND